VACGPENINLEIAVISMANIFNSMDVKSINYGFKKNWYQLVSIRTNYREIGSYQNSHFWQNDKKHKLLETMRFERKFQKIQKIHVNPKYKMSLASFWHHTLLLNYCLYSTRLTRWNFFFGDFEKNFKIFIFYYPVEIFTMAKCKC